MEELVSQDSELVSKFLSNLKRAEALAEALEIKVPKIKRFLEKLRELYLEEGEIKKIDGTISSKLEELNAVLSEEDQKISALSVYSPA